MYVCVYLHVRKYVRVGECVCVHVLSARVGELSFMRTYVHVCRSSVVT